MNGNVLTSKNLDPGLPVECIQQLKNASLDLSGEFKYWKTVETKIMTLQDCVFNTLSQLKWKSGKFAGGG